MKNNWLLFVMMSGIIFLFSCKHDPTYTIPPTQVLEENTSSREICFESEILPLLQSSCGFYGCHNGTDEKETDFNTYEGLMDADIIKTKDPIKSEIIRRLRETDPDKKMPQAPIDPWTDAQINTLLRWIEQGAKNTQQCSQCDTLIFTFARIQNVLTTHCTGCHSGSTPSGNILLNAYSPVKALAQNGKLMGVLRHQAGYVSMPQGLAQLAECDLRLIEKWIEAGYPE